MIGNRQWGLRRASWLLACLLASFGASGQAPQDWHAHVTLANDYRRYGLSQVESGVAIQAGVDYRHHSGFFAGAVASNVDYLTDRFTGRDGRQLSAYVGFAWDLPAWDINTALHRYRYPSSLIGYDYTLVSTSGVFRERLVANLSYTDALLGRWGAALNYELGLFWPVARDTELTVSLGQFHADELADNEYTHWNVGLSRIVRRVGIDVRYYGNSATSPLPIGDIAGPRWVLSLSYAIGKAP